MEIILAEKAGFCFGVKRAVEKVMSLTLGESEGAGESRGVSDGRTVKIYTVGNLIHNPQITGELKKRGVSVISAEDIDRIFEKTNESNRSIIVIRAHGVRRELSEKLAEYSKQNSFFEVCDMTCPYVKKIHKLVWQSGDRELLVFGDPKHPEVDGICSYAKKSARVFESADGLERPEDEPADLPVTVVSQTTQSTAEWKKCQKKIKKLYTNALVFDTICSVTEERQKEADNLSRLVDAMIVVGGRESSNTAKLFKTAKANLKDTFFVEDPLEAVSVREELGDRIASKPDFKVGITAGASTPGAIIQEVIKHMSENTKIAAEENFAELLENSLKTLNTGETVVGIITSITQNELHVDLGTKFTGIISADDISDDPINLFDAFKVGDEIKATVIHVSDRDGVATLSKKRADSALNWDSVVSAFNAGEVIEGKIIEAVKGGVILRYKGVKIFVPASQSGVPKDGDLNSIVGQVAKAKIIDINEGRKRAVASIRVVKNEERKQKEAEFWANIEIGKKFKGEVKSLTSYGAFVDLGGVDGMVHSSELSWRHIKNPSEVVSVGDVIDVFVKDFDPEKKRISLGYKTEETNPWNIFKSKYNVGDIAEVKIVSLMPFGAFAEIIPGVDGLIHISQITNHKIANPAEELEIGQTVNAKIVDVDDENRKISLSMRALIENNEADEPAEEEAEQVEE